MIARITVEYGDLTEYPLAECVRGGWQNGVRFYPDEHVTEVQELHCFTAESLATHDAEVIDRLADQIPVDLWATYGGMPREKVLKIQEWVHEKAARIRRGEGE